jgi:hypothetical protein
VLTLVDHVSRLRSQVVMTLRLHEVEAENYAAGSNHPLLAQPKGYGSG